MYIVFEGGECCGKTTILAMLKEKYPDFVYIREPGTTPFAMEMRKNIFAMERDAVTDAYLFAVARSDLHEQITIPKMKAGETIISDRSFITSMVYQGYANDDAIGMEKVYEINKCALKGCIPDKCIVFTLPYEESQRRANARRDDAGEITYFDERGRAFYDAVQDGYKKVAEHLPEVEFVYINANQSIEAVFADVEQAINK